MSEDFDREAEKERLREKLEDDQESRKATEHMSDLLLKGATMTNAHCEACGDPIFRYDGREFCPTCGETVEEGSRSDADPEDATAGGDAATDDAEPAAADAEGEPADGGATDAGPSPTRHEAAADEAGQSAGAAISRGVSAGAPTREGEERETGAPVGRQPPAAADLGEARASLVRTLTDLAARAEGAEDVRRARDLLAAAREAAEALAALDRADR